MQKTQTGIRLHFKPFNVKAECQNYRKQDDNITHALRALKIKIALLQQEPLPETECSKIRIYLQQGLNINPKNPLFPLVLSHIIGLFWQHQAELKTTAVSLGTSVTKLATFFSSHKEIYQKAQLIRQSFNKSPLRSP